jgi:hypothetical protein
MRHVFQDARYVAWHIAIPTALRNFRALDGARFGDEPPDPKPSLERISNSYVRRTLPKLVTRLQARAAQKEEANNVQPWFCELSHSSYHAAEQRLLKAGRRTNRGWSRWVTVPRDQMPWACWLLEAREEFGFRFQPELVGTVALPGTDWQLNPVTGGLLRGQLTPEEVLGAVMVIMLGVARPPIWTHVGACFAPPIIERRFDGRPGLRRFALVDYGIDWTLPPARGVLDDLRVADPHALKRDAAARIDGGEKPGER